MRKEDTTAFYIIHFPLVPIAGVKMTAAQNLAFTITPNPSKGIAKISYFAPKEGELVVGIYDLLGNEKMVNASEIQSKGYGYEELNLSILPQGMYYVRASLNGEMVSQKLVLTQ